MFVCLCVCVFACSRVRVFACSRVRVFACSRVRVFACSRVRVFACSRVRVFVCLPCSCVSVVNSVYPWLFLPSKLYLVYMLHRYGDIDKKNYNSDYYDNIDDDGNHDCGVVCVYIDDGKQNA